jgi:WD40 repeat protein
MRMMSLHGSQMTSRRGLARGAAERPPILATVAAPPTALAWSAGGTILAVGKDTGEVELLSPATGGSRQRIRAHGGPVQSMAWHPRRDALLTTGRDGAARLWVHPFVEGVELVAPGAAPADHACWSAAGDRAAVAVGRAVRIFAFGGRPGATAEAASEIAALAFTPSGAVLGAVCHGGVSLFAPATGAAMRGISWQGRASAVASSPDGSLVACGHRDGSLRLWRSAADEHVRIADAPETPRRLSFSHDGRWLAAACGATISVWKDPGSRPSLQLLPRPAAVTALAHASHGARFLSGSTDGTIDLWAPPMLAAPVSLARLTGEVTHVAWGPDPTPPRLRWAAADEHGRVMIGGT